MKVQWIILLISGLMLGCGQRGPLYIPATPGAVVGSPSAASGLTEVGINE